MSISPDGVVLTSCTSAVGDKLAAYAVMIMPPKPPPMLDLFSRQQHSPKRDDKECDK